MRSWAVIDLDQLVENYRAVSRAAGNGVTLLNVIKADAYGHGSIEICRSLEQAGADQFAVTSLDEAATIRKSGSASTLTVLSGLDSRELPDAVEHAVQPIISTKNQLAEWSDYGEKLGRRLPCHIKLNTGMNRLGFDFEPTDSSFLSTIQSARGIEIVAIATHLASAGDFSSNSTEKQLDQFAKQLATLSAAGIRPKYIHAANSAALAYRSDELSACGVPFTMARPGLALYGYVSDSSPTNRVPNLTVVPVLEWMASLIDVRPIRAGASLGYGATYRAERDMTVGVVSVGYADGYSRRLSNRGTLSVRGVDCPVVGLVSMDLTLVDLTAAPNARTGDQVTILSRDTNDAKKLASLLETIPYEVLCGISTRVERRYKSAANVR